MAKYAMMARDAGARIIGGCCGTQPEHLVHMRSALESSERGKRPSLEMIADTLGAFSSAGDGTGDSEGESNKRRSRRRKA